MKVFPNKEVFQLCLLQAVMAVAQDQEQIEEPVDNSPLWKAYSQCKPYFGGEIMLCDPDGALVVGGVKNQIDDVLWRLQSEVPCYCDSETTCYRYEVPIPSGVIAALVAFTGGDLPDDSDLAPLAQRIYNDAKLSSSLFSTAAEGRKTCDNGLLLVYAVDTRSLYFHPGAALAPVFNHLQTHKRRVEPQALAAYLEGMLTVLQRSPVGPIRKSVVRAGWRGWEMVAGMIAAAVVVTIAIAALFAVFVSGCCGSKGKRRDPYLIEREACRRYEKECQEWSRRARRTTKRRTKMLRAMQKPDWPEKVEAARRRLDERKFTLSTAPGSPGSPADNGSSDVAGLSPETLPRFPYYMVSEPNSLYNSTQLHNWANNDGCKTTRVDQTPFGTMRSDRRDPGAGTVMSDTTMKRETQRCDFYFPEDDRSQL